MILTLSKQEIGTPSTPTRWSNEEQKLIPIDYKKNFLGRLIDATFKRDKPSKSSDMWGSETKQGTRKYWCDTIADNARHYHLNYMGYLEKCWADHLGVVVTPDIIWFTLLNEVASLVRSDADKFQGLFTKSDKKETLLIPSGDVVVMPLDTLTSVLKEKVPTDANSFFPEFSTRTPQSFHAFQAAFCDICSPYYNYMMLLCDIPKVDVRGTLEDWKHLADRWENLSKILGITTWTQTVSKILKSLVDNFHSAEFWKTIFSLERCGSGHQTEASGWFVDLFREQPHVKYVENYSPHIALVKYKQVNLNADYEMSVGIFGSTKEDDFMVPDFSFVVNEVC